MILERLNQSIRKVIGKSLLHHPRRFQAPLHSPKHPLPPGQIFHSHGGHFSYRVIGPCCRLFDREELPWPCCRLQWRGKEPSWRRIGRRFVSDIAARTHPSYCVEILGQEYSRQPFVLTLYAVTLAPALKQWWYSKKKHPPES